MTTQPPSFKRLVLGFQSAAPDRTVRLAVELAELLDLELLGHRKKILRALGLQIGQVQTFSHGESPTGRRRRRGRSYGMESVGPDGPLITGI